jgi:hypothetical protein
MLGLVGAKETVVHPPVCARHKSLSFIHLTLAVLHLYLTRIHSTPSPLLLEQETATATTLLLPIHPPID